ncbi:MAG: AbrB/MazE/SpoVT family DNA-binding domain-containing protein [bacterium]|nr:AbrB/MazE/SpoVT family DNA-binding domain-containing protein [bacterium]
MIIDRPILDLLHIKPETPLELSTNGDVLMVRPNRTGARQKQVEKALEEVNRKYGQTLKMLAE